MKKFFLGLFLIIFAFACNELEPRRPVQQKSGSFIKESVERSKQIIAVEEKLINKIITTDSLRTYQSNPNGFWYYLEKEIDSTEYTLQTDDEALITYNIMNVKGDTIYSAEELGNIPIKVDKSKLFPGLRNGLKLLKEGEKALFIFPSTQAYGYKGDNNKIEPNQPIKASVQIIQIINRNNSKKQTP